MQVMLPMSWRDPRIVVVGSFQGRQLFACDLTARSACYEQDAWIDGGHGRAAVVVDRFDRRAFWFRTT